MANKYKIWIDEAWRWPWLWPVVACALCFSLDNTSSKKFIKKRNDSQKISKKNREKLFEEFYNLYPKKQERLKAEKSFMKLKPSDETFKDILNSLSVMKDSEQWNKDKGQFIPMPATWLNNKRWEDDMSSYHKHNENAEEPIF